MHAKYFLSIAVGGFWLCLAPAVWSDVPAPPVNQIIGMPDIMFGELTEADCRACHTSGVPDRHHLLHGTPIPEGSFVPYPDADNDGTPDSIYTCLSCHETVVVDGKVNFAVERDCVVCHTSNAHHRTPAAASGDCVSCHGDIVDNIDDGHYIPTYEPSKVTPSTSDGEGLPLNSRRNGAGACDYCHDDDGLDSPLIRTNAQLHHATSDQLPAEGALDCVVCHDILDPLNIRVCEGCHGPESLHNIQVDSPAPGNIGTIVVGGEYAGYGHVGRDAGPGDSDCWGCHGFDTTSASAPGSGPIIPTVFGSDFASIHAGSDAMITLSGTSFVNTMGETLFVSEVALTAADGSSVILTPDLIMDEGAMVVTIPGGTSPGNYDVRAIKGEFASNPAVISVVPETIVSRAFANRGRTYILGNGFGSFAEGSGTTVAATYLEVSGRRRRPRPMTGEILSWTDSRIIVSFPHDPRTVTVKSIWGGAKYTIRPE